MPVMKILHIDILSAFSDLASRKAYGPDGVFPVVLSECGSVLATFLVKLFCLCLFTSTFLPVESLLAFTLFLRKVTTPILQTADPKI